ncbi:hypothetical protein BTVI_70684 [Pitangus sulphuratus]|nr:hypothetical protein BTVI_70684 [Pitangus sulphuratus]
MFFSDNPFSPCTCGADYVTVKECEFKREEAYYCIGNMIKEPICCTGKDRRKKQMKMCVWARTVNPMRGEKKESNQNSSRNKESGDGEKEQKKDGRLEGEGPEFYTCSKMKFYDKRNGTAYWVC